MIHSETVLQPGRLLGPALRRMEKQTVIFFPWGGMEKNDGLFFPGRQWTLPLDVRRT